MSSRKPTDKEVFEGLKSIEINVAQRNELLKLADREGLFFFTNVQRQGFADAAQKKFGDNAKPPDVKFKAEFTKFYQSWINSFRNDSETEIASKTQAVAYFRAAYSNEIASYPSEFQKAAEIRLSNHFAKGPMTPSEVGDAVTTTAVALGIIKLPKGAVASK